MTTITLRNITKRFEVGGNKSAPRAADSVDGPSVLNERANALENVSIIVRSGETLALVGPSGCGKTTLLRVVAGLIHPEEGEVLYDGVELSKIPKEDRGIGMVFQTYALYPHLRSFDNIGFFDIIRRQPERVPQRIEYISEVMGIKIKHLLSRKPPTLSGGEQQRVAVARALARDPKLFLFDEPLSNLDAKLRVDTRVQLKKLLQHYKITAIYVTHDQTEAIALADRIAIMNEGRIEQVGTFREIYSVPRNLFVAQFLGTPPMNIFEGKVHGNQWQGRGMTVEPIRPGLRDGQRVYLGVRPEHVLIGDSGGVEARVELVEPIFTDRLQLVYMEIAGQSCVAKVALEEQYKVGTTVWVKFMPEEIFLFDKNTQVRIG